MVLPREIFLRSNFLWWIMSVDIISDGYIALLPWVGMPSFADLLRQMVGTPRVLQYAWLFFPWPRVPILHWLVLHCTRNKCFLAWHRPAVIPRKQGPPSVVPNHTWSPARPRLALSCIVVIQWCNYFAHVGTTLLWPLAVSHSVSPAAARSSGWHKCHEIHQ